MVKPLEFKDSHNNVDLSFNGGSGARHCEFTNLKITGNKRLCSFSKAKCIEVFWYFLFALYNKAKGASQNIYFYLINTLSSVWKVSADTFLHQLVAIIVQYLYQVCIQIIQH